MTLRQARKIAKHNAATENVTESRYTATQLWRAGQRMRTCWHRQHSHEGTGPVRWHRVTPDYFRANRVMYAATRLAQYFRGPRGRRVFVGVKDEVLPNRMSTRKAMGPGKLYCGKAPVRQPTIFGSNLGVGVSGSR